MPVNSPYYSPKQPPLFQDTELGVDSDDTRPIITVDQRDLNQRWRIKSRKLKHAMIAVVTAAGIIGFGVVVGLIIYFLT